MAIQMRRGNEADLDISKLKAGEIAVCLDTGKMIIKLVGENYITLTDTPEIDTKLTNLKFSDLKFGTTSAFENYNSLTTSGIFYIGGNTYHGNCPPISPKSDGQFAILAVLCNDLYNHTRLIQIYFATKINSIYFRTCYDEEWEDWKKVSTN